MPNSKVFISSYGLYNAGFLTGKWFDLEDYTEASELENDAIKYINDHMPKGISPQDAIEELFTSGHESTGTDGEDLTAHFNSYMELKEIAENTNIDLDDIIELKEECSDIDFVNSNINIFDLYKNGINNETDAYAEMLSYNYPESELPCWATSSYWAILEDIAKDGLLNGGVHSIKLSNSRIAIIN